MHINQELARQDDSMRKIQGDGFSLQFDPETGIMRAAYSHYVTANSVAALYQAGMQIVTEFGIESIRGLILDFRQVARFHRENLFTVQSESYRLNSAVPMDDLPVSVIVATPLQQQIVRTSLNTTPGRDRKRMVETLEEALAFIADWHAS